jgi:hypothetical protein
MMDLPKLDAQTLRELGVDDRTSVWYRWMYLNHDTFAAELAPLGRVNWKWVARFFERAGFADICGEPPSGESLRKSWRRVQRRTAEEREARRTPGDVVLHVGD